MEVRLNETFSIIKCCVLLFEVAWAFERLAFFLLSEIQSIIVGQVPNPCLGFRIEDNLVVRITRRVCRKKEIHVRLQYEKYPFDYCAQQINGYQKSHVAALKTRYRNEKT